MKELIAKIIEKQVKFPDIEKHLETPGNPELGDFSFPCFILARQLKKSPMLIASDLKIQIEKKLPKEIEKVEVVNGYLNFFVNKKYFAEINLARISKQKEDYGKENIGKNKKIMIEFPSPNTNKPLHLGHLRNISLGDSISRLHEFVGFKVIKASLTNDRGIHICKSMLAYKEFAEGTTPQKEKKKSDHFIGDYYVLFNKMAANDTNAESKAQEMLQKWESGDKETLELWRKMNSWAIQGIEETYDEFGLKINKNYYESKLYKSGKEIIQEGLKKGIFQKKADGSIIINLEKEGLGEKVVLRADGTSIYITQDLYLAKLKFDEYKLDKSVYVTGNEQDYHFQVLFLILKKLGYKFSDKLFHLSYGMVFLPEGKMKSREGTVVDADDLISNVQNMVIGELKERYNLTEKELESRSLKIALAAIKYNLLKIEASKNMVFNPKESISFEGNTGPYLQYSYARASSILKKINKKRKPNKENSTKIKDVEFQLVKKMAEFPDIVNAAYKNLNPAEIANYAYQLSQIFNEFYHASPVLGSEEETFRLQLVQTFRIILKNSLNILGIDAIEEM